MFTVQYQGVGRRLIAHLIDWAVLVVIFTLVYILVIGALEETGLNVPLPATIIAVDGVITILYFVLLEGSTCATLGKRAVGIIVLREDGSKCGYKEACIRNILRIIDILPFFYIVGAILIARSSKRQRLGDRIGKTVVISSKQAAAVQLREKVVYRYCVECGAKLPIESLYCPKCGARADSNLVR